MRLTTIILITAILQVSASSFAQKITLSEKNAPIVKIFEKIRTQSGYDFMFSLSTINDAKPVTINVQDAELKDVLKQIFVNQPLEYRINEKSVVISPKEPTFLERLFRDDDPAFADIRGVVRNERGEPLEGITVMVRGAKTGTRTNAKGEFALKGVKKGDVLVFTGVAIEPFEYTVKDDKNIELNLKARLVQLEEVAVEFNTGYQKISKERAVGSFEQLDSAAFHRRAGMGILERLDGMVPAVLFNKKGGSVGGYPNPIQIRGISTLNSNPNPLIVVDNFPVDGRFDLNTINPNDIDNITILKDAAAASIWGARAGNGVIVITTKKGKYNTPISISGSSNVTIENKPDLYYIPRISTSDFIDVEKDLYAKGFYNTYLEDVFNWPVLSPVVEILDKQKKNLLSENEAEDQISDLRRVDIREQLNKYIYREAVKQQHHLNFDGGTKTLNYNVSFGYNDNSPNIQGSKGTQQYTVNTATNFKPFKNFEIQTRLNYSQSKNQTAPTDFGWSKYPYLKIADDYSSPLYVPYGLRAAYLDTLNHVGLLDWRYRPLDEIRLAQNKTIMRSVDFNLGASYQILNGLSASIIYQYRSQNSSNINQNAIDGFSTRSLINRFFNPDPSLNLNLRYPVPLGAILNTSYTESATRNGRASLNYNKSLGLHKITVMLGAESSHSEGYSEANALFGYDDKNGSYRTNIDYMNYYPLIFGSYLGNTGQIPNNQFYKSQPVYRFISLLGNVSYSFKDRYFVYGSARRDGANVFGVKTNNKWKPLWSIGGKWQISDEQFFELSSVQALSLRASYGYSGNTNSAASGRLTMLYANSPGFYSNFLFAQPISVNNPDLRWEEVGTLNMGVDFSAFKGRISGSVDMFWKKSTDLIANYPLDPTVGANVSLINSANLRGDGFEVNVQTKNLNGKVTWTSNLSVGHAKTIVTKLYQGGYKASDFIGYTFNPSEGKLAYAISSYRWAGLDPLTGDPQGYLNGNLSKDYNAIFNDSIQNQIYHGSSVPLYNASLGNSISYKNFNLSFIITGRFNYFFRKPALEINKGGELGGMNYGIDYYQRWQQPGDEKLTNIPSVLYPVPGGMASRAVFYTGSEVHVLRADNIKLQDIRFAYNWFNKRNGRFPIKSGQVFFYPNNLNIIIWRKNRSSLDPEFTGGTNPTDAPAVKTWTLGASFNL